MRKSCPEDDQEYIIFLPALTSEKEVAVRLQRIKEIEGYLMQNEFVSLDDLAVRFEVSKMTIRRDVAHLVGLGIAKKVYGGVIASPKQENLVTYFTRSEAQTEEKRAIGRLAASLVEEGDVIFIDAGSTTAAMVPFFRADRRFTVVTHNLGVLHEIASHGEVRLIVIGGDFLKETYSTVGIAAIEAIRRLNVHKAFLGASAISLSKGIMNSSSIEAEIKRAIIQVSDRKILLADSQKLDRTALVTFCQPEEIDTLITDRAPPPDYLERFDRAGVEVVVAGGLASVSTGDR